LDAQNREDVFEVAPRSDHDTPHYKCEASTNERVTALMSRKMRGVYIESRLIINA